MTYFLRLFCLPLNLVLYAVCSGLVSVFLMSWVHSCWSIVAPLFFDLAALNDSPACCLLFAFLCKFSCLLQLCRADSPVRCDVTEWLWPDPEESCIFCAEVTWLGGTGLPGTWGVYWLGGRGVGTCRCNLTNPVCLYLYSLCYHIWIGRRQFCFINTDSFFMSLLSTWYIKHTGNDLSGDNRSRKEIVINRKPACSTVKRNSNGLPGENKAMKGAWLNGIKTT